MFFQGSRAKKYFVYFKTDNEEKTNFQPFEAGSDNSSMAKEENRVVAYLRAFYKEEGVVKIGRVLTLDHGKGTGRCLAEKSLEAINEKFKYKKIIVDSQKHAVGFYEKFGFKAVSDVFLEEGVEHISMELKN